MNTLTIGVVIPTWQAVKHLPHCLPPLIQSPLKPRLLIIDSSSTDGTVELAQSMGVETITIPQSDFNHGTTRELARNYLQTDIIVMLTQDAYATSSNMLHELTLPLINGQASVAYARQLPHKNAGFFGAVARNFNYPATSHIRSLKDLSTYGVYTFFCSNSCAAYLNNALDKVGGFPFVLFGEDTVVLAKLLHLGHHVAYVASAEVYHSHDYTLKEEFRRHFDIGLARRSYQDLIAIGGKDSKRGQAYVKSLLKHLKENKPSLIPYALLQCAAKFSGYQLGKMSENAPYWFKRLFSSQKYF